MDNFKTKFRLKHEQASESQQSAFSGDRGQYSALDRGSSSRLSGRRPLIAHHELNIRIFSTGVNDTGGKFAAGVNDTGGNLPPVSMTPAANFATGVNDTNDK